MQPSTLLNPHNQPIITQKLSVCCPILNHFLSGGIPCNSITEVVAESGSGKTQLCLQLLLSAQLPVSLGGLSSSSLFLHTEFPFPFRRLRQLSLSFLNSHKPLFASSSFDPMDHVFVQPIHDAHHLFDILLKLDSFLVRRNSTQSPIKLIVIDSIAAVFRSDFDNTPSDLKKRSSFFFKISGKLRELAEKFGLAVGKGVEEDGRMSVSMKTRREGVEREAKIESFKSKVGEQESELNYLEAVITVEVRAAIGDLVLMLR
ncbi:DNA repair protein XRCC3-like protein [Bienertia sinuspersici]